MCAAPPPPPPPPTHLAICCISLSSIHPSIHPYIIVRLHRYELAVSEHQAAVLLLWNDRELLARVQERDAEEAAASASSTEKKEKKSRDKLGYLDIAKATGLSNAELKRTLQSLACFKQCRMLRKKTKGNRVSETDEFIVNSNFSSKTIQVSINAVQHLESTVERKTTDEFVQRERQFQMDAAVVRIMKSRRTLTQTDLFTQVRVG